MATARRNTSRDPFLLRRPRISHQSWFHPTTTTTTTTTTPKPATTIHTGGSRLKNCSSSSRKGRTTHSSRDRPLPSWRGWNLPSGRTSTSPRDLQHGRGLLEVHDRRSTSPRIRRSRDIPTTNRRTSRSSMGSVMNYPTRLLDAMETVATISHSNQVDGMATEYLSDAIPASPTEHVLRPKTRLRAKLGALVIPEPCTDIPSESEETTLKPQGRPARRSSATARA